MRIKVVGIALVALLLAGACGRGGDREIEVGGPTNTVPPTTVAETPELDALRQARTRWEAVGPQSYAFVYEMGCECDGGPFDVEVVGGEVVSGTGVPIEDLFATIEDELLVGNVVEATYNEDDGRPEHFVVNPEALAYDGGYTLTITSFDVGAEPARDLAEAEARWADAAIGAYSMTYSVRCFCPEQSIEVSVADGDIVESSWKGDWEPTVFFTVDDLFDELRQAVDDRAFSINVTYDDATGRPLEFFIDFDEMVADEEWGIEVTAFVPG